MQLGDSPHDEALKHPRHQPPGETTCTRIRCCHTRSAWSFSEHTPSWSSSPSSTLPSPWWSLSSTLQLPLPYHCHYHLQSSAEWFTKCVHGLHAISTFHFLQSINPNKIQRLSNTNYIMYIYVYYVYIFIYIYTPIDWKHVSVRWNLDHVRNTKSSNRFGTSEGFTVRVWWGPSARRPAVITLKLFKQVQWI